MRLLFIGITLGLFHSCQQKKEENANQQTESIANKNDKDAVEKVTLDKEERKAVDIYAVQQGNANVKLLIFEYFSISNKKQLKDFEVRESNTDALIFRSSSSRFYNEQIYNTGEYDFISIDPIYTLVSINPLVIKLQLSFYGDLKIEYFESLMKNVTYDSVSSNEPSRAQFDFLTYKLNTQGGVNLVSTLNFQPKKCCCDEISLSKRFEEYKISKDEGDQARLAEDSFICFINGRNMSYPTLMIEFRKNIPESSDIYNSYPYIDYLDNFIKNLHS